MKTQKSFKKKALLSSLAMLMVALVALSSATFAWFSTKTTATAEKLSANTTQGTNLMISESKTSGWTQALTFANKDTTTLDPVSTDDLTKWYAAKADGWDDQKAGTGDNALKEVGKTGYVLEQDIYVKYDAAEGDFNLNVSLNPTANSGTLDYYRVAITPITTDADLQTPAGFTQNIYANSAEVRADDATYANYTANTSTSNIALGKITAKQIYGYHVSIWFEGEDVDCIDSNSTNDISLAFSFAGTIA